MYYHLVSWVYSQFSGIFFICRQIFTVSGIQMAGSLDLWVSTIVDKTDKKLLVKLQIRALQ